MPFIWAIRKNHITKTAQRKVFLCGYCWCQVSCIRVHDGMPHVDVSTFLQVNADKREILIIGQDSPKNLNSLDSLSHSVIPYCRDLVVFLTITVAKINMLNQWFSPAEIHAFITSCLFKKITFLPPTQLPGFWCKLGSMITLLHCWLPYIGYLLLLQLLWRLYWLLTKPWEALALVAYLFPHLLVPYVLSRPQRSIKA